MSVEIENYKARIEFLEKKVAELEKSNKNLTECLRQQYEFSAKVSNIIFDMDSLLTKKSDEIARLEMQLKNDTVDIKDFAIDLAEDEVDLGSHGGQMTGEEGQAPSMDVNDYVICHGIKNLEIMPNHYGVYECPSESGCSYQTTWHTVMQRHIRTHSKEKPFECRLCGKMFPIKASCIQHIRGHDDNLKIRCSVCAALFTNAAGILKHTAKYHNGAGYRRRQIRFRHNQNDENAVKKRRIAFKPEN